MENGAKQLLNHSLFSRPRSSFLRNMKLTLSIAVWLIKPFIIVKSQLVNAVHGWVNANNWITVYIMQKSLQHSTQGLCIAGWVNISFDSYRVSVSRRTFGPSNVNVYAWFTSKPQLTKSIWSMAVCQHQFFLDRLQNKVSWHVTELGGLMWEELAKLGKFVTFVSRLLCLSLTLVWRN